MALLDALLAVTLVALVASLIWLERSRLKPQPAAATAANGSGSERDYDWRLVRQSGLLPDDIQPILLPSRVLGTVLVPLLTSEFFGLGWSSLLAAAAGFFTPDMLLGLARRQRQRDIRQALSFFLDLLLSLLQAGLSLEDAFRRASVQGLPADHPLAQEVSRIAAELSVGRDRGLAFRALAERTGVQELSAVAEAVTVGLSRGISLESTLKSQADLARARRREDGMRRLDKANAEILIPLLLCSFPMFIALVIVPLGLQLMDGLTLLARVLRP